MGQFDYFTSGEAHRVFQEGERRNAEIIARAFLTGDHQGGIVLAAEAMRRHPPRDPSIVTFKDWLDSRSS